MPYATVAQLLERFDSRTIGQLASDSNVDVAGVDLPTDPRVLAALNDASGDIDSALLVGGMYSTDNLAGLSGNSNYKLIRLTCQLAMLYLYERRPMYDPDTVKAYRDMSQEALDRLRKGENVFDISANLQAGVPSVDGPTAVEYRELNLVRDRASRAYPARRLPHNR